MDNFAKKVVWSILGLVVIVVIAGVAYQSWGKKPTTPAPTPSVPTASPTPSGSAGGFGSLTQSETVKSEIVRIGVDSIKNSLEMKREFVSGTPVIYIRVDLNPLSQGLPRAVRATLVYLSTGDQLGPVGVDVTQAVPQTVNFTLSRPVKGWPKGESKIQIKFGSSYQDYLFSIR